MPIIHSRLSNAVCCHGKQVCKEQLQIAGDICVGDILNIPKKGVPSVAMHVQRKGRQTCPQMCTLSGLIGSGGCP